MGRGQVGGGTEGTSPQPQGVSAAACPLLLPQQAERLVGQGGVGQSLVVITHLGLVHTHKHARSSRHPPWGWGGACRVRGAGAGCGGRQGGQTTLRGSTEAKYCK